MVTLERSSLSAVRAGSGVAASSSAAAVAFRSFMGTSTPEPCARALLPRARGSKSAGPPRSAWICYARRGVIDFDHKIKHIEKTTLDLFKAYSWPGNIRELQNVVERAVILCDGGTLSIDETWFKHDPPRLPSAAESLNGSLADREREMIEVALRESKGRIAGPFGAAAKLGIPRQTLDSKIAALRIDKSQFKA